MNYDKLDFVEAIEELSALHGLDVPYEKGTGTSQIELHQRQNLYQLMEKINQFYCAALNHPSANKAKDYLSQRGLSADIISHFSIGFCARRLGQPSQEICCDPRKPPTT